MTWLLPSPWSRINDNWISEPDINALPGKTEQDWPVSGDYRSYSGSQDQCDWYHPIALDLITESVYNYPYPFVTEKTFRAMACKRMFILVAPAHTLKLLKEYGFKTFSPFIDEKYDAIEDPHLRFHAIMESFEEFCRLPLEDVKRWMKEHQDLFEHNYRRIEEIKQIDFERFKKQFS